MDTAATPSGNAGRYGMSILRWLLVAFAVFVLVVLGGLYVINKLPVIYTATTEIQIQPRGQTGIQSPTGQGDQPFYPTRFDAEFTIMRSADVLIPVIQDLNLDKAWAERIYKSKQDRLPPQEALAYMNKMLKLEYKDGTNIIVISASSDVPQEAADIANGVADQYKKMRDNAEGERSERSLDSLRSQLAQQQKLVDEKKAALEKLQEQLHSKFPGGNWEAVTDDLLPMGEKNLLNAKEDYDARRVLLANVINLPDDEFISTLTGLGRPETDVTALQEEVQKKDAEIDDLVKNGVAPSDPKLMTLRQEDTDKRGQLKELIAGLRRAMQVDTEMAKSRVDLLQKEVNDLKAKSPTLPAEVQAYREAQHELEQQQMVLDSLKVRIEQDEANRQVMQSPVRIIALAEPPRYPSSPNKFFSLVVAVIALAAVVVAIQIIVWIKWPEVFRPV